jgi:hypothetical protein
VHATGAAGLASALGVVSGRYLDAGEAGSPAWRPAGWLVADPGGADLPTGEGEGERGGEVLAADGRVAGVGDGEQDQPSLPGGAVIGAGITQPRLSEQDRAGRSGVGSLPGVEPDWHVEPGVPGQALADEEAGHRCAVSR